MNTHEWQPISTSPKNKKFITLVRVKHKKQRDRNVLKTCYWQTWAGKMVLSETTSASGKPLRGTPLGWIPLPLPPKDTP